MKSKKVPTILTIVTIIGIAAGVFLVKTNQDFRERAAPATSLSMSPSTQTVSYMDTNQMVVMMDTGTNSVTGVDLDISFDPDIFEVTSVVKASGINNLSQEIQNVIDNANGAITYSAFTLSSSSAISGSAVSALTINFRAKDGVTPGNYSFTFGPQTAIAASTEGQNVLINSTPGLVTVQSGSQVGQPTATASPVATASPTNAPGQNIGGGSNVTPTVAPTATARPSATSISTNSSSTATAFPVPQTGNSTPTIIVAILAIMATVVSLAFAL